jgi:Na+/melibiose symporter-like transporter
MLVSILLAAGGTHRYIPVLRSPPEKRSFELPRLRRELGQTLSNRSFQALFWANLLAFVGFGLGTSLSLYVNTFFWDLASEEIRYLVFAQFLSPLVAIAIVSALVARFDKKRCAVATFAAAILVSPAPVVLRLLGLFPGNESPWLLPLLVGHSLVEVTLLVLLGIFISSMLADVAEEHELRTGRREEGLFFAARAFAQKATSGLGIFLAGIAIEVIGLESGALPGEVEPGVVTRLGLIPPLLVAFYAAALWCVTRYRITREAHATNLSRLREGRA